MKQIQNKQGFTLVECMVMMLILMITLGGTLGFRYFSVLSAQRAEDQLLAAHAAQVISDAWRGQKGAADFDPTLQGLSSSFQIQSSGSVDTVKDLISVSATPLGLYRIDTEERTFRAVLSYEDDPSVPNARLLHITLIWQDTKRTRQQFQLSTLTRTNV